MRVRRARLDGGLRRAGRLARLGVIVPLALAAACTSSGEGGDGGGVRTEPGDAVPGSEAGTTGAVAGIVFDGRTYTFIGGDCVIPEDRASIEVQIGEPGSGDFFRFVLGGEPGAPPLEGAETYFQFTMRGAKEGVRFALDEGSVTLAEDLREGTFSGDGGGGPPVAGSFSC